MDRNNKHQVLRAFSLVGTIGLTAAGNIAVGLFAGRWLDNLLGSTPWATVIGIVAGVAAGLWSSYKIIMANNRE